MNTKRVRLALILIPLAAVIAPAAAPAGAPPDIQVVASRLDGDAAGPAVDETVASADAADSLHLVYAATSPRGS